MRFTAGAKVGTGRFGRSLFTIGIDYWVNSLILLLNIWIEFTIGEETFSHTDDWSGIFFIIITHESRLTKSFRKRWLVATRHVMVGSDPRLLRSFSRFAEDWVIWLRSKVLRLGHITHLKALQVTLAESWLNSSTALLGLGQVWLRLIIVLVYLNCVVTVILLQALSFCCHTHDLANIFSTFLVSTSGITPMSIASLSVLLRLIASWNKTIPWSNDDRFLFIFIKIILLLVKEGELLLLISTSSCLECLKLIICIA